MKGRTDRFLTARSNKAIAGTSSAEVVGRDLEVLGVGYRTGRPKVGGGVNVHFGIAAADAERKAIGVSHRSDAGNCSS
jgi:hypothetical protein